MEKMEDLKSSPHSPDSEPVDSSDSMQFPSKWQSCLSTAPSDSGFSSLELLLSNELLTSPKRANHKTPTARLLEELCCRLVQHIADHDWNHPDFQELMADDYRSHLEYHDTPYAVGRDAYINNYRQFTETNPSYRIECVSAVADVHENNSTAAVWMVIKVDGHPRDVQRESVTIAYWRRRAGKWQAYKQLGMRGAGGYF